MARATQSLRHRTRPRRRGLAARQRVSRWTRDGHSVARNVHVLAYFLPLDAEHPLAAPASTTTPRPRRAKLRVRGALRQTGLHRITLEYLADDVGQRALHRTAPLRASNVRAAPRDRRRAHRRAVEPALSSTGSAARGSPTSPRRACRSSSSSTPPQGSGTIFSIAHPLVNYVGEGSSSAIESTMPKRLGSLRERGFGVSRPTTAARREDPRADGEADARRGNDPDRRLGLPRPLQRGRRPRRRTRRRSSRAR